MSFSIAFANTAEPLIGAWLLRYYVGGNHYLSRLKGVICLWFFASFISGLAGAALGATVVWLSGMQPNSAYGSLLLTWWLADAGGALIFAPLLLAWGHGKYSMPALRTFIEFFALLLVTAASCIILFIYPSFMGDDTWVHPYMAFPLLIWGAVRFGQRGITLMTLLIANFALSATLYGLGTFGALPTGQGLIVAQIYVMIITMLGLTVCAAISERCAAEEKIVESRDFLQKLIDHIPDPVYMKNKDNILTGGNKALWSLLGEPAEKFIGGDCDAAFAREKEAHLFHEKYEKVFETGETDISEEIYTDQDGKEHVMAMKIALLRQNKKAEPLLVVAARDITELKETEKRLLQYTQDLENSNRELDDFAYIASHDLKQPLRGLQSFSQFLLEDYRDELDKEGKAKLQTVSDLAQRMDDLLNGLLHYSQLGRTALAKGRCNMGDIAGNSAELFSINLKQKNMTVKVAPDMPCIVCDHVRIGEVFRNLIGNALKYNDKNDGAIEIGCVTDHPRAPGKNVYFVRDHGIGIPKQHLKTVFKIFKRLHTQEAYGGGTGSGLAIAKKIIVQHGGEIWAESEGEGKGATFFFTVPQRDGK